MNKLLAELRSDMVNIAKNNFGVAVDGMHQDKRLQMIIEKTSGEYQDRLNQLAEEMSKVKKDLKEKSEQNKLQQLEIDNLKSQLSELRVFFLVLRFTIYLVSVLFYLKYL
jgi:predicted  nucleic acid-binding Zn-ribbon protein